MLFPDANEGSVRKGSGRLCNRTVLFAVALAASISSFGTIALAQDHVESSNMKLVGYNDLQGRASYMPIIKKQGDRYYAYVGSQDGKPPETNPLTGKLEPGGTSIVDVTDAAHPKLIAHIPGEWDRTDKEPPPDELAKAGPDDLGGAQYMRVCLGSELPHADPQKAYMLRAFGRIGWEMWDVTDPAKPTRLSVLRSDSLNTHRFWWECGTGIAYFIGGPFDWNIAGADRRFDAYDHALIYDIGDPLKPKFLRTFGIPGQEPGSSKPLPPVGLHTVMSTGPEGNRVYFAYGNAGNGVFEIVDREKLLSGPTEPTDTNLMYPVIAKVDLPADTGAHTVLPLNNVPVQEFAKQSTGNVMNFLLVTGQGHNDNKECHEVRQMVHLFDISTESKPLGISTWTVPEKSGNFCDRGAVFGSHATNDNMFPVFYPRMVFVAFHNAGVRALDVRDPYNPKEVGYYIPSVTSRTQPSCYGKGAAHECKTAIDINNVEVDDRGYVYGVDFAGGGLYIWEVTGAARELADYSKAVDRPAGK